MSNFPYEQSPGKVVFRAGLLNQNAETKVITADKRKGIITVEKREDYAVLQWKDAENNAAEPQEYFLFEGMSSFEWSKQKNRVLLLKIETDYHFFWMQEKDASFDAQLVQRLNQVIEQAPADNAMDEEPDTSSNAGTNTSQSVSSQQQSQQSQQQQQQQQGGGSGTNEEQLRRLMQLLGQNELLQRQKKQVPYLSELLDKQFIDEITQDDDIANQLIPYLPEGQQSREYLSQNLRSAQLLQSLELLDHALNSGEAASLLQQIGLDYKVLHETPDGNDALYKALLRWAEKNNKKQ